MPRRFAALCATGLGVLAMVVAGCGGSDEQTSATVADTHDDPGLIHVHALGVDPADGAVMLATHTGLFRLAPDADRPELVGTLRQDTMGFTVVGARRYLGSGHPDLRTDQPPLLGLISSSNGGRTWTPVSLLGLVDFHILRAAGRRVVGMDSQTGLVFVSDDRGRRWTRRTPPGDLVDLVLDPADSDRFVASTADGLQSSADQGRTWTPLAGPPGYLAWPAREALFVVGADGQVALSTDGGETWAERGSIGGEPSAVTAQDATHLLATTHDGALVESRDAGTSWTPRAALD